MNNNTILIVIVSVLVGGIVGYTIANSSPYHTRMGFSDQKIGDQSRMGSHQMPDGSMMGNMDSGKVSMDHMMDMMVKSEKEFLAGMIPHHQEAVDTAKEVLARGGTTPEIKQLVENIIIAQEKEISDMKQWYQTWYGEVYVDNQKYSPMMRELSSLSGEELDRAFLEDMIMHHMGAIMMAKSVQPFIEHNEIADLTKGIVTSQSAEIQQMRQMLTRF